jgi:hypothetical protein
MATVYRFHNAAAVSLSGPGTRYMTAADARAIAAQLVAVADSIAREDFPANQCGTVAVEDYTLDNWWRLPGNSGP